MKRAIFLASILTLLALTMSAALSNEDIYRGLRSQLAQVLARPAVADAPTNPPAAAPGAVKPSDRVVTGCRLEPARSVELGFNTGGMVAEVLVSEGDQVRAGQILARLANRKQLEASVARAERDLVIARQEANSLYANAYLAAATALKELNDAPLAVTAAQDRLDDLVEDDEDDATTAQAEAELALARARQVEAQRKYDILKNGPDPDEAALAGARLKDAEAQLAAAREALDNLELRAPIDATVARLGIKAGEYTPLGAPVVVLADFSHWQVRTTNLTELKVVLVRPGAAALITFDALPDQPQPGFVQMIEPLGESREGDILYNALIEVDIHDERLRWNMTCTATILTR